jgi:hypothetical protein
MQWRRPRRNREQIQEIADRKHRRRQLERGAVVVRLEDLMNLQNAQESPIAATSGFHLPAQEAG